MKSVFCTLSGVVAVLALAGTPLLAQGDRGPHGGGSAGGGGGAAPGAGGGGSAAANNGGGGGGGTSSGSMSGGGGYSGGGGGASTSGGFSGGGSSASVGGASPMGGARPMGTRGGRAGRGEAGAMMRADGAVRNALAADPGNASVPGGSRPNYGNPTIGTAVPRGGTPGGTSGGGAYYPDTSGYYPYYGAYGDSPYYSSPWLYRYYLRNGSPFFYYPYDPFFMYGYGAFGLGLLYYDPLWFGSTSAGWGAMGGGGESSSGFSAGGWSSSAGSPSVVKGGLKLKVTPKDAEVYVDGYYMGRVDQYNGAFQRLDLPVGVHRVELRAKNYNNVSFEVKIEPRDIQTYHGTMQSLQPVK